MKPPAFISAPFAGPTLADVRRNVARAVAIGRLAETHGYVPTVPHLAVALLFGGEDGPDIRRRSLDLCLGHLDLIRQHPEARMYLLLTDDGSLSHGVGIEREAWGDRPMTMGTWSAWRPAFADAGEELLEHYNDPGAFWTAPLLRS